MDRKRKRRMMVYVDWGHVQVLENSRWRKLWNRIIFKGEKLKLGENRKGITLGV